MLKFRSGLIGLTLTSVVVLASANAADMYRAPEGLGGYKDGPVPYLSWTGFYGGLSAGGAWSSNDVVLNGLGGPAWNPYYPDPFRTRTVEGSGFIGGGQIGYNRQFDKIVAGIEADISGLSADGSLSTSGPGPNDPYKLLLSEKLDWLATVRGRLGYLVTGSTLFYATAGLAVGGVSLKSNLDFTLTHYDTSGSDTKTGYTVGGGVEHALTSSWSVKAEYLFYDLGKTTLTANPSPPNPPFQTSSSFEEKGNIVRAGINYHFGSAYEPLK
jgi:outer membrane immunogenic protein